MYEECYIYAISLYFYYASLYFYYALIGKWALHARPQAPHRLASMLVSMDSIELCHTEMMKRCKTCRKLKPLSEYYWAGNGYYRAHCKPCTTKAEYRRQKRKKAFAKGELRELSGVGLQRSTQALEHHIKDFLTNAKPFREPLHITGCPTPFLIGLEFSTTYSGTKLLTTRTGNRKDFWDLALTRASEIAAFLWENHCEVRYAFA